MILIAQLIFEQIQTRELTVRFSVSTSSVTDGERGRQIPLLAAQMWATF